MNRKSLLFFICFLLFLSSTNAQQQSISLVKYRSGKTIKIVPGEKIKIRTKESTKTGELFSIQDSLILISRDTALDTFHLAAIKWIKYKHKSYGNSFMQGSAISITIAGPLYILFGIANNSLGDIEPVVQEENIKNGALLFLVGASWYGITELIINKKHNQTKWKIILNNFNDL